ncbi:MAG: hypothetical protein GY778_20810 [bacterium]|nr:hypothetical protein [bacterium]
MAKQPQADLASEMCGACHTDSHHPTIDEWTTSGHESSAANSHSGSCTPCHAPLGAGESHPVLGVECTACHNSHKQTGNNAIPDPAGIRDSQLLYPEVVVTVPSNSIADATDPSRFNLCGQCHHSRGRTWDATSRGPHHSLQGNVIVGEMPMPVGEEATPLVPNVATTHSDAALQCGTCHMYKAPHENGPPEVDAITGHLFSVSTQNCNTAPGCHSSVVAAEAALAAVQGLVQTDLDALKVRLGDVAMWGYSCCDGPPEGTPGQDQVPDEVKKARFLISYVEGDASLGGHNPAYVQSMMTQANDILDGYIIGSTVWPPAAGAWWGACCDATPACLGTMTEADCTTAGGTWHQGEDCADTEFVCP